VNRAGERAADVEHLASRAPGVREQAEVDQHRRAVGREENVLRLEITVHDARRVYVRDRLAQPSDQIEHLGEPTVPRRAHLLHERAQRTPLVQLHREPRHAVLGPLPDDAHDAGMPDLAEGVDLAAKPGEARLVHPGDGLQGHPLAAGDVLGQIDDAPRPLGEHGKNPVGADSFRRLILDSRGAALRAEHSGWL
jgi:hypothetical protein